MFKFLISTLDRLFALAGALIFSQIPTFMQQYKQEILGHLKELQFQLQAIQDIAEQSGKNLDLFIHKFRTNADIDFEKMGDLIEKMKDRYEALNATYFSLNEASAFKRPFVFFTNLYGDIVDSTIKTFNFGLEFSIEGLIYILVGLFFGYSMFAGFKKIIRLMSLPFKKKEIPS